MAFITAFADLFVLLVMVANAIANPLCSDPSEGYLRLLRDDQGSTGHDIGGDYVTEVQPSNDAETCANGSVEGTNNRRYTCPPVYNLATSASMFPSTLSNVTHCACDSCYVASGSDWSSRGSCEVVRRTITVLRRGGCEGGVYNFVPENVEVGVACACVLQKTIPANVQIQV